MVILGISGSLREKSSNSIMLEIFKSISMPDVEITISHLIGRLPFFSPDLDDENSSGIVKEFRRELADCDGVIISTPEYAFGMPGVLKNALDWTVSSGELLHKPLAAISASPTSAGGDKAHASLLLVLKALSAKVVPSASFPFPAIYKRISKTGELLDPLLVDDLRRVLVDLVAAIKSPPQL